MSAVNATLADVFVLRDDDNAALTGLAAGDFDTLEAYLITAPGTTATVTLTEIGDGEYRASFVPTEIGSWLLHYVYGAGTLFDFREEERRYEVTEGAVTTSLVATTGSGYTTRAIIKARLNITGTAQDDAIDQTILAASREIDGWCGQTFTRDDSATIRYVTARFDDVITVPPIVSVSAIAVDRGNDLYDTTWETTDFVLHPRNAATGDEPYTEIRRAYNGRYAFPVDLPYGVRVTGIFGWPIVPTPVAQACALQASRLWARSLAPLGLAGSGEFGLTTIATVDPDVKVLLAPYRVMAV